ncbi:MAG: phage tail assembly chaperone [Sphingomonas sp.]|uniref:phage tail assembly chaperone n=1 Tax=Sphingomonas sp. TaxID=28214 RepID=UPI0025E80170|nr:phage tail assembly chaperone [Sphingomonas sp.]MBX9880671.1 phage tail assembly chaperone [Sphingomonas sp.]
MDAERFAARAAQLAGFAGLAFGWRPDEFWRATPAELAALVAAARGDDPGAPPDPAQIARLMEQFPDG